MKRVTLTHSFNYHRLVLSVFVAWFHFTQLRMNISSNIGIKLRDRYLFTFHPDQFMRLFY